MEGEPFQPHPRYRAGKRKKNPNGRDYSNTAGYVYLMGVLEGCYKIGYSHSPEKRLKRQVLYPVELAVVASISSLWATWLERYLHLAFDHRRVRGEWFCLTAEEVALVAPVRVADKAEQLPPRVVELYNANAVPSRNLGGTPARPESSSRREFIKVMTGRKIARPICPTKALVTSSPPYGGTPRCLRCEKRAARITKMASKIHPGVPGAG